MACFRKIHVFDCQIGVSVLKIRIMEKGVFYIVVYCGQGTGETNKDIV